MHSPKSGIWPKACFEIRENNLICAEIASTNALHRGVPAMSHLLAHPALWPMLALDPEPFHSSVDPDSTKRLYSELYGLDSGGFLMPCQRTKPTKFSIHANLENRSSFRPASEVHPFARRD